MKANEIRGRSLQDVRNLMKEMQRHLFELRLYGQTEETPDVRETRKIRRDIARCKTIMHEMELAESSGDGQES